MIEKKLFLDSSNFSIKMADDETSEVLEIEGYANTASVDRVRDSVLPSAWENGIKEYLKNPVLLAFHDHSEPVGRMVDYKIDTRGLWIKGRISTAAEKIYKLVKDKVISAFSVSFMVKDAEYDHLSDIFVVKELELIEISIVSVGMNRDSLFDLSKSFSNSDELLKYKMAFAKEEEINNVKEEIEMTPEDLQKLLADTAEKTAKSIVEAQEAKEAAEAAAKAKQAEFDEQVRKAVDIKLGETGTEKLLKDIEARFESELASNKSLIEGLQAEIKEKATELEALTKSKMVFKESSADAVSLEDKTIAVMLSTVKKAGDPANTKFGASLLEKYGAHVASATWELEVSTNMEAEVRRRLVVAPALRAVSMMTNVMTMPLNPEAGLGTWVTNAQFGTSDSSGAAQTHQLGEITLNAYKVATKEYVALEEEEDALIPILPVVRDAMIRRLARAIDRAYLRGAGAGADPVKGLATYDAVSAVTQSIAGGPMTLAKMRALRKDLGAWGLDPAGLLYIVSTDVMYDLLDDTDFQTMEKVGNMATFLTGQIGVIGNSPVVVSAEFDTKANLAIGALCFAPQNFIAGNQRGLRMDTDVDVINQRNVLVASMRTGMTQLTTNLGAGVSAMQWTT